MQIQIQVPAGGTSLVISRDNLIFQTDHLVQIENGAGVQECLEEALTEYITITIKLE